MASRMARPCPGGAHRPSKSPAVPGRVMATVVSIKHISAAGLMLLVGGCSLAPPVKVPEPPTGAADKEVWHWTQPPPADRLPRDSWWTLYYNAELDQVEG